MFGRTQHKSTVAIFGGAAFWDITQEQADTAFEGVISAGVNHIDIAPSYGKAESLVGPWMKKMRKDFFLGCKTMERGKEEALAEAGQSLQRLQTDHFDLYQCHAVTDMEELDKITKKGGAIEALSTLKKQGTTRFLGITSHGLQAPTVLLEALKRFNFDTILFPFNAILCADPAFRKSANALLEACSQQHVGSMVIKSIAKGRYGRKPKTHATWYEPFTEQEKIQKSINFVLSHPVTGICTAGDILLLPDVFAACSGYRHLSPDEIEKVIEDFRDVEIAEPLF